MGGRAGRRVDGMGRRGEKGGVSRCMNDSIT